MSQFTDNLLSARITALTCAAAIAFTLLFQEGGAAAAMTMNEDAIGTEPWRLVSATLAHGGLLHLYFNVYWLWRFGKGLEVRLSPAKWLLLLAVTAAGSGAAQYATGNGGIGLSGVLYGVAGYLWVGGRHDEEYKQILDERTTRLLVGWFFFCIVLTEFGIYPIANTAHGIGAVLGVIFGWASFAKRPGPLWRWAALSAAFVACLAAARLVPLQWLSTEALYARAGQRINRGVDGEGDPEKYVDLAQLALARDDGNTQIWPGADYFWYVSAFYKHKLGRNDEATAEARRAFELNPALDGPASILAVTLYNDSLDELEGGDLNRALELLREVVQLDPSDQKAWEVLADVHRQLGNTEQADKAARRAAALR